MKWTVKVMTDQHVPQRVELEAENIDAIIPALEEIGKKRKIVYTEIMGIEPHNVIRSKTLQ